MLAREMCALGTPIALAVSANTLGALYGIRGLLPAALEHFQSAPAAYTEINDSVSRAHIYFNLGSVYSDIGAFPEALECPNRALDVQLEIGDQLGAARTLSNFGAVYLFTSDYPRAVELAL